MKFIRQQQETHKGPGKFLKVEDGGSVNGIFRGEIFTFYNKWVNGKGTVCHPDDPGAKPRFKLNFVTYEDGKFIAKIFEFPQTVYNQLADIAEVYPLEKTKVKVTRRGTGTDTVYNFIALTNEPISPVTMTQIEAVSLHVLDDKTQPKQSGVVKQGWADQPGDPGPELPF